jgi:glycosyltransferase involved in cell wall biosynthesis
VPVLQPLESAEMRAVIAERDAALEALTNGVKGQVSVVIPCYQQSHYLGDALASVAAQTVPPLETIVVDDGSDSTHAQCIRDRCDQYGARYVRVTNRGLPNARNTGLMLARGEWFLPLDADDALDPTYIEKTLAEAETSGADVVLTGIQEVGPYRKEKYLAGFDRPWQDVTVDLLLFDFNRFFYCSLFRTKTMREIGGYNGRLVEGFEDYSTWIDLLKRGVSMSAVPEYLFLYTTRADSMLASAMAQRESIMAEIRRHHA